MKKVKVLLEKRDITTTWVEVEADESEDSHDIVMKALDVAKENKLDWKRAYEHVNFLTIER